LGKGWLLLASALVVAASLMRQGVLLLVAILLFILYGVVQIWAKYALSRIEYKRNLSSTRAFFGDTVTLELSLANRKILPLPWVQVEEELDELLPLPPAVVTYASHRLGRVVLRNVMPLGWYHRVRRVYQVHCVKRGYYSFGPTHIQSGDYFRLRVREMDVEDPVHLIVYPKIVPLIELGIPSRDPFGDIRLRRHLFQDPVRVASIRDYAPGDPLKRIHWKASARVGRLQTKVFEHTTSPDLAIFLDVRTVKHPLWGEVTQLLETLAIAAASIADHVVHQGYRVGLYVNQPYPNSNQVIRLPPSSHPEQLQHILEALAMVTPTESIAIDKLVRQEGGTLPWVSTLITVTAVPTQALVSTLEMFRHVGRPVALVIVGEERPTFSMDGLPLYYISAKTAWERMESVGLDPAG
jgi:uncharacterized protein (DUF58 family)